MKKKLVDWLRQQPKEFIDEYVNNDRLGNGAYSIEDLIALDLKYNPEGNDNVRSDE